MITKRLNSVLAERMGVSRRQADALISSGRVFVGGKTAVTGQKVEESAEIKVGGRTVPDKKPHTTIHFHKPVGYVSSRRRQGSAQTIYDILPAKYHELKPAGRLDKDSSGLMVLSSDGQLIYRLTHPSFEKEKVYLIELDQPLTDAGRAKIESGVELDDGISRLELDGDLNRWVVRMHEGRNRQIRRTFDRIGYNVVALHRLQLANHHLGDLKPGQWLEVKIGSTP